MGLCSLCPKRTATLQVIYPGKKCLGVVRNNIFIEVSINCTEEVGIMISSILTS
jgi:hypothetical protein